MDTTGVQQDIIAKIQKLQALADNAGTEFEAALAAQRVADMCRKHNLDIGVARLEREESEASEATHTSNSSKWEAHWTYIAAACEKLFGVGVYKGRSHAVVKNMHGMITGTRTQSFTTFYGLKSSIAAANVTYEYLLASVEAMLEGWINTGHYGDRRSFRIGCAKRVFDECAKIHTASRNLIADNIESMALVRLEGALLAKFKTAKRLRSNGRASGASNRDAYGAGYAAGARIDPHGARSSRMLQ